FSRDWSSDVCSSDLLSGRAVANAMEQRFDRALADFGLARIQLASAGDALAVARVDANLGVLEVDRGHPAQALPHLDRAARDFERSEERRVGKECRPR